ncbi:MAG: hypothetical protein ACXWSD_04975 [Bdellovibrionota bacterium]
MNFLFIALFPALAAAFQGGDRFSPPGSHATPGTALYLHLAGADPATDPSVLFTELEKRFENPLYSLKKQLRFSYVVQTGGKGVFTFNLIVEPLSGGNDGIAQYLSLCGTAAFHGVEPNFQHVDKILTVAQLEAGKYREDREDPFDQSFSLERSFAFSSFQAFESFSNGYGYALLNPKNSEFLAYLESFVGNDFASVRDNVLAGTNMVAIEAHPYLILAGDAVAGPEWDTTPFLPFKFFRNCYSQKFENGMCFKP